MKYRKSISLENFKEKILETAFATSDEYCMIK